MCSNAPIEQGTGALNNSEVHFREDIAPEFEKQGKQLMSAARWPTTDVNLLQDCMTCKIRARIPHTGRKQLQQASHPRLISREPHYTLVR